MIKNYVIGALVILAVVLLGMRACTPVPVSPKAQAIHDTITVVKERIKIETKEVVKWKKAKDNIRYVTEFDTLATLDTVIIELAKCDSIVRIDSVIIAKLDTIVNHKDQLLTAKDQQIKEVKKSARKEKRKAFFRGIATGAVVVGSVILYLISI